MIRAHSTFKITSCDYACENCNRDGSCKIGASDKEAIGCYHPTDRCPAYFKPEFDTWVCLEDEIYSERF